MDEFKISLKAARHNANLTQEELAKKLRVNRTTVNNWETGKSTPDFSTLNMISKICGVPLDFIFLPNKST